jgi:urease accessory protein
MKLFNKHIPKGASMAKSLIAKAATITLDWDQRQRSRLNGLNSNGEPVALFLQRGKVLRNGDVMVCETGELLKIIASAQSVLKITACSIHGSPLDLQRAAYHLGNRHIPLEIQSSHLLMEPDHVIEEMLKNMGLIVEKCMLAFEPEAGAYEQASSHRSHHHHHEHHAEHAHDHH